ncbi:MAG: hypothetical protein JO152_09380 [Mycobacteriaceae bacterium]|nr:hypothetical protein [Mycobacteriaceae bacterium]
MRSEPFGAELIERYLRTRRLQYFRGHHDEEYFFILKTSHGPLHVHVEIPSADRELFTIRVTPPYFLPQTHRSWLMRFSRRWHRRSPSTKAVIYRSTVPDRVGVAAESAVLVGDGIAFADFALYMDHAIASAIKLFGEISSRLKLQSPRTPEPWLRDAG